MTDKKEIKIKHSKGLSLQFGAFYNGEDVIFTCPLKIDKQLRIQIYDKKGNLIDSINMLDYKLNSAIASCCVQGIKPDDFTYVLEEDGIPVNDSCIKNTGLVRKYGDKYEGPLEAKVYVSDFDWDGDETLKLPFKDVIAYQLHVRGFTAHKSSKVKNRGTFLGLIEKIPYLKELGINQIILMPAYEFDEYDKPDKKTFSYLDYIGNNEVNDSPQDKLNYWGFKEGLYYLPKVSYAVKNPVHEYKTLIREMHKAGIEVIMRIYFPVFYNKSFIRDMLRFWVYEYHVDGFFLMGEDIPIKSLAGDLWLRDTKLYCNNLDKDKITQMKSGYNRNIAVAGRDFEIDCRKFLKSDEDMLQKFLYRMRNNPNDIHIINYITDYQGFTLNDLVSYDYKHNEANGEDNRDGENYNYSWNCGVEGISRKQGIIQLRTRQIKNAFIFLLFAQGVPMLLAGDEFLNSQNGNNNPYCQDNEIGWLVWKNTNSSRDMIDYVKGLIRIRKEHPVLRPEREFRIMDYAACGFPDLSYHGEAAWAPRFDNHLRNIGLMICGKYARIDRVTEDDYFYFAYNMHWEEHLFALPKLPKGIKWSVITVTSNNSSELNICKDEETNQEYVKLGGRTVAIVKSYKEADNKSKENKNISE